MEAEIVAAVPSRDAEAASEGLYPYGAAITGVLNQGERSSHPLYLEAGYTYVLGGSCDADCTDMDLALLEDGMTIVEDVELDALPVAMVVVVASRSYELVVSMPGCTVDPCGYRVQAYR